VYLKYLLETPGNVQEFCFHDLLDTLTFIKNRIVTALNDTSG